jgi:FMN phosphatase YigB (HAD superfamily)
MKKLILFDLDGTIFRYQDSLAAFLWRKRPKEKLTKERAEPRATRP